MFEWINRIKYTSFVRIGPDSGLLIACTRPYRRGMGGIYLIDYLSSQKSARLDFLLLTLYVTQQSDGLSAKPTSPNLFVPPRAYSPEVTARSYAYRLRRRQLYIVAARSDYSRADGE
jgi:hypothetical protein